MIRPWLVGDTKLAAEKGGAEFGDEFLHGIRLVTKPIREIPVQPPRTSTPMGFMPISA
jgi:hypothetical protein